ncbi:TetR/AcrR family transcriptional regulator [Pigmentiphaga sp. GD03639]|uniref:TetR/AcrR family transcriptional regulator n=1 Tax=unclassified Pigmentiphaga TaxID=2626614 RepID=UPI000B41E2FF|nr:MULTISPECIES: TetR/AcrR family transcriptional regulator [unclassified Pigmentiphaga]MDH2236727.1 TetR/AcrR family transcriptional regulator [Pigmentiphaga sp. GD03639]OVZ65586.1 TetR family transcriptional regulator [Pigmentiphaga sp. NML030171]
MITAALPSKRQRTREHIATVAGDLFERHGYEAVTMEQIAVEAGVVRGTLYNHFAVKEAVLAEWMHARLARDLAPLMQAVMKRKTFASRIPVVLDASARWWEEHRQYAAPYIRFRFQQVSDGSGEQASSDMVTAYTALIHAAQQAGEVRDNEPPERLANYLHFLYLSALMSWLGDPKVSLRKAFARAFDFFLQGASRP